MCGRYTLTSKKKKLEQYFGAAFTFEWAPFYNAAPSQELPVILNENPHQIEKAVWGFLPAWADKNSEMAPMINVRSETIGEKPSFRDAFLKRRCLVPSDGFYESRCEATPTYKQNQIGTVPQGTISTNYLTVASPGTGQYFKNKGAAPWKKPGKNKTRYYIHLNDKEPFAFAGIWENRVDEKSGEMISGFAILTTEPNAMISSIYHRMPVILNPDMQKVWLSLSPLSPETLEEITRPYPPDEMSAYPVSSWVNSPENNSPDCIRPILEKAFPQTMELFS